MAYKQISPQIVSEGGTGAITLTDFGVLVGSGVAAVTPLAVGTDGQLLIGASAADPAFGTVTSTGSTIDFTLGANTLNLETGSTVATQYNGDVGSAAPAGGIIAFLAASAGTTAEFQPGGNNVNLLFNDSGNNILLGNRFGPATINIATNNTGLGPSALNALTSASHNTAIGFRALTTNTEGALNTVVGADAMLLNVTGNQNTAVGYRCLLNTLVSSNTAVGHIAGDASASGTRLTIVGDAALSVSVADDDNTAIGYNSLITLNGGEDNTALGSLSLVNLATGGSNIAIGLSAGTAFTTSESSNIIIGHAGVIADDNTIRIGDQGSGTAQQDLTFIAGITGVAVSNKNIVNIDTSTGQLGAEASVDVANGGTGATTLTGVLTGNGTAAFTVSTVTDNTVVMGSTSNLLQDTTITVTDAGEMINASQPAFLAVLGTSDANLTGDGTVVLFGNTTVMTALTEIYDQNSDFTVGGAGVAATFTAPVTGRHHFELLINLDDVATQHDLCQMRLVTSNRTYDFAAADVGATMSSANVYTLLGSTYADLDATDTAHVTYMVSGHTKTVDLLGTAGAVEFCTFSGALIC